MKELEDRLKEYELTLSQTANYFRKCDFDFGIETKRIEEESEKTLDIRTTVIYIKKDKGMRTNRPIPFSELITSKPFNFYSMFHQINGEDKEKMFKDTLVQIMEYRNKELESQSYQMNEDLFHFSKQIKLFGRKEDKYLDEIDQLKEVGDVSNQTITTI